MPAMAGVNPALPKLSVHVMCGEFGDTSCECYRKRGAVLGGEESGHIIFLNHHTTGDGIISALQLLAILQDSGKPLSELAAIMQIAPQRLINVTVSRKPPIDSIPPLQAAIRKAELELGNSGRVLVRYSGTQAICRVMVESMDPALTQRMAESLAELVQREIG